MILHSGTWSEDTSWDFHVEEVFPEKDIVAAASIIFNKKGQVLQTYNIKRKQWEIPGGHIERSESPEGAAYRELFEEGGVQVVNLIPFGFRAIQNKKPVLNTETGRPYPSLSYSFYYVQITDDVPDKELAAQECSCAEFMSLDDIRVTKQDHPIITYAWSFISKKHI